MITVKINCDCGQHYAFDVEPVGGRMPVPVACPACGADGTVSANTLIGQSMAPQPAPAAVPGMSSAPPATPSPPSAPPPQSSPRNLLQQRLAQASAGGGEAEKWKWWYFVLAGICIGGYSIWQAYDQHRLKPLGELFLAVFCIVIGIWDFQHKRKKKRMGG
jgi:hypothetical protein